MELPWHFQAFLREKVLAEEVSVCRCLRKWEMNVCGCCMQLQQHVNQWQQCNCSGSPSSQLIIISIQFLGFGLGWGWLWAVELYKDTAGQSSMQLKVDAFKMRCSFAPLQCNGSIEWPIVHSIVQCNTSSASSFAPLIERSNFAPMLLLACLGLQVATPKFKID